MAPGSKGASGFVVKVQVPLSEVDSILGANDPALLVYDKKRSFQTYVGADQEPAFTILGKKVRDEGLNGLKGYFNARLANDGLVYINPTKLLPRQTW